MAHTFRKWMIKAIPYDNLFDISVDFENPFPTDNRRDATLAAAFHCLIKDRIPEGVNRIVVRDIHSYDCNVRDIFDYYEVENGFKSCIFYYADWDNVNLQSKITLPNEWEAQEIASKFTGCYVTNHVSKQLMVIFIPSNYNLETWHRLGALLPKYPVLEDMWAAKPLTEDELKMLKSLSTDGVDFDTYIKAWIATLDLRTSAIKKMFNKFIIDNIEEQIRNAEDRRRSLENNITDYAARLARLYSDLDGVIEMINRLMIGDDTVEEKEKRLIEFLLTNKNVEPIRRRNDRVEFNVHAAIDCWDNDMFSSYINNRNSLLYHHTSRYSYDQLKRFYEQALFAGRFKIQGIAKFEIEATGNVRPISKNGHWPSAEIENCIPNTHVDKFTCIGNHRRMLDDAAQLRDYEQAILIAIQITQSVNWSDGAVMNNFIPEVLHCERPILTDRTGNTYTVAQVISILDAETKETEK